jgi:ABC-type lipopolysaccharide export system ATPase subunit
VLDEPFTHFSPIQIENVKELLIEAKAKKGLLVTDHMYKHITDICDSLYFLINGKTLLTKSVEEIDTFGYARLKDS